MPNNPIGRPYPWTAAVPNNGPGGVSSTECGCEKMTANRLFAPLFGDDDTGTPLKIPKSFKARFAYIGPQSEWDSCVIQGGSLGDWVVSVGAPSVIPFDTDLQVRCWRTFNALGDDLLGTLDLVITDRIPESIPTKRAPLIYPTVESAALSSATETVVFLSSITRNKVAVGNRQELIVAGRKNLALYLLNFEASDISWRLVGMRFGDGGTIYPISPTGYPSATPTYNTLAAGHNESWDLDLENNSFDAVYLIAKSNAGGTVTLFHGAEVRD